MGRMELEALSESKSAGSLEDGGPFVKIKPKRGKAARSDIVECRDAAVSSCFEEFEEQEEGDLAVTREELVERLEKSYEREKRRASAKNSNKKRSVRGAMREKLEERLEEKGWRIVDGIQRGESRGVARTQGSRDGSGQESESRCGCIVRMAVLENDVALGRATIAELLKRVKELERKNTAEKRTQDDRERQGETVGKRVWQR